MALAVEMTNVCQELHCLPGPGGLLQQDSKYIWMMGLVREAQAERMERDAKRPG